MSTHHQFLKAIAASPGDQAPRLMYADWLEERGDLLAVAWRVGIPPVMLLGDYGVGHLPLFQTGDGFCATVGAGWGNDQGDGYGNGQCYGDSDGDGQFIGLPSWMAHG